MRRDESSRHFVVGAQRPFTSLPAPNFLFWGIRFFSTFVCVLLGTLTQVTQDMALASDWFGMATSEVGRCSSGALVGITGGAEQGL